MHSRFPYGLLGEDYGILSEDDLAANTCHGLPRPFSSDSYAYPYWQCFETRETRFICESLDVKRRPQSAAPHLPVIEVTSKTRGQQEFLGRRGIDADDCNEIKRSYDQLTQGTHYVCISGEFGGLDQPLSRNASSYWVLDKFKTRKGCDSYFVGGCSLKYQLQHGCTVKEARRQ